ncbi:MAG: lysoplasmalogenase [Treponema sp.]
MPPIVLSTTGFIPFVSVSCVHLVCCFFDKKKIADITKVFLMPLLCAAYTTAVIIGDKTFSLFIVLALAGSWLGDVFLLGHSSRKLFAGIIFFAAAQLTFTGIAFRLLFHSGIRMQPVLTGSVMTLYLLIMLFIFRRLYNHLGKLRIPVFFYMCCIAIMGITVMLYLLTVKTVFAGIAAVGSLFFIASDTVLSYTLFVGEFSKSRFVVMITYLTAEAALIIGMLGGL